MHMHGTKRVVAMAAIALVCFAAAAAESYPTGKGRVLESVAMPSKILGQDVLYSVYLPPDFDSSNRTYPVMYFLHGGGDNEISMIHHMELHRIMDEGIADGSITPMVVISPSGWRNEKNDPRTYFTNDADGGFMWTDMFIKEFIPFVEKEYRGRKQPPYRGISGVSMGGYGAFMLSFLYPDLFNVTVTYSAAINTEQQFIDREAGRFDYLYGKAFDVAGKTGRDRLTKHYYEKHPWPLLFSAKVEDLKKLRIFMDVGSEDELYLDESNFEIHKYLKEKGIKHRFVMRTGTHYSYAFFRDSAVKGMQFASDYFRLDSR